MYDSFRTLISLALLSLVPAEANAATCSQYVRGFTVWEIKTKGKMELRVDEFELGEWSPDSQFDGIALTSTGYSNLTGPVLEVERIMAKNGGKLSKKFSQLRVVEGSEGLQSFGEFVPSQFFAGLGDGAAYRVKLFSGSQLICEEIHKMRSGD